MTTLTSPTGTTTSELLQHAALRALKAPSVHNTQPWRFVIAGDTLEIRADRTRQLLVLDPRGRQMTISCGCALFNARVAIEAAGYTALVDRMPDPDDRELLAVVTVGDACPRPHSLALDVAIDERRTNRRQYLADPVPDEIIEQAVAIAAGEGIPLTNIADPLQRTAIAALSVMADHIERCDPAYVDEIAAWTSNDPGRTDGVPAAVVPNGGRGWVPEPALPLRNLDPRGAGALPPSTTDADGGCLLLFSAREDTPMEWLRVGEALEHVWLELTNRMYWASPLMQAIEVSLTRGQLQRVIGRGTYPQLMLRVGRAPSTVPTSRRPAQDVIEIRRTRGGTS